MKIIEVTKPPTLPGYTLYPNLRVYNTSVVDDDGLFNKNLFEIRALIPILRGKDKYLVPLVYRNSSQLMREDLLVTYRLKEFIEYVMQEIIKIQLYYKLPEESDDSDGEYTPVIYKIV